MIACCKHCDHDPGWAHDMPCLAGCNGAPALITEPTTLSDIVAAVWDTITKAAQ